jgi:hypothetical protein
LRLYFRQKENAYKHTKWFHSTAADGYLCHSGTQKICWKYHWVCWTGFSTYFTDVSHLAESSPKFLLKCLWSRCLLNSWHCGLNIQCTRQNKRCILCHDTVQTHCAQCHDTVQTRCVRNVMIQPRLVCAISWYSPDSPFGCHDIAHSQCAQWHDTAQTHHARNVMIQCLHMCIGAQKLQTLAIWLPQELDPGGENCAITAVLGILPTYSTATPYAFLLQPVLTLWNKKHRTCH